MLLKTPRRPRGEEGYTLTTEVLILIPLALMFMGFLVNAAIHWVAMQYVQHLTNQASKYAAAALGDNTLPFIPDGGYNMTPSGYLNAKVSNFWLTPGPPSAVSCEMVSKTAIANGIARCSVTYTPIVIPTDPISYAAFGKPIVAVAESLNETGLNPNVQ